MHGRKVFGSISIIGGADGPTAIFLAGGEGFKTAVIVFVLLVLLLAAVLILWKPGVRTKYRFIRLSAGNLLIHLMDGLVTLVNTPDLSREGNPLVSRLGLGWGALFTANLIGFVLIVLMTWCFNRYEHVRIPSKGVFDYYMKLFYGEGYRPVWYWCKLPKNRKPLAPMVSYSLYWGLTAAAPVFVLGWIWDMLGIRIGWWHDKWLALIIGILVAYVCMYKWTRDGYRLGAADSQEQ